jgi:hypothetical protein
MQVYVDLDGVLAWFDHGYERLFNVDIKDQFIEDVDWSVVREDKNFFRTLPLEPGARGLWASIVHLNPIILTGCPPEVPDSEEQKREWCSVYLGNHIKVICCRSKDKSLYCNPGDVLIDDWEKYKHLWINAGGVWITHTSAYSTISNLRAMGII